MTHSERHFHKELPGADIVFQPDDISDYQNDAWDIRVSLEDAPLEEAFYVTVDDPDAARDSITELLDKYVFNPATKDRLDIEDYPDLPFIQDELIQYQENARRGLLELTYYINNNPVGGPVNLWERADQYFNVCTYHDQSHDYRVLDLILVPSVEEMTLAKVDHWQRQYGHLFLLMFFHYSLNQGDEYYFQRMQDSPVVAYLNAQSHGEFPKCVRGLKNLEMNDYIKRSEETNETGQGGDSFLEFTERGESELNRLLAESQDLAVRYDCFDSVSVSPPALGVPDGFDLRVQMIDYDGYDTERSVVLRVLEENQQELFDPETWCENYETFFWFNLVTDALAYMTHFSGEVLAELKRLAERQP